MRDLLSMSVVTETRWGWAQVASPAVVLFMSVFTSQAAVLVLAPILVKISEDLDVSTAVAGQLRVVAAPVAALVAVLLATLGGGLPLRRILFASSGLVVVGSLASAAAGSFAVLAIGQVPLWVGVAGLVSAGIGAAGAWSAPEMRAQVAARALAGAPAAWVLGMPLIGLVAGSSWRLAFLVLPLPAGVLTAALVLASHPVEQPRRSASLKALLEKPGATRWAVGELLAMSAWAGTLVFSGALFIERYGTSPRVTGVLLAVIAVAYLGGNVLGGRVRTDCSARRALARANLLAAVAVAATWILTPNLFVTLSLFAVAAIVVAARTVVGTTYGFTLADERNLEVGSARSAITHIGYLAGSLIGGGAIAVGGRASVGLAFGLLLLLAAVPYRSMWRARCARTSAIVAPAGA
jgi:DHA1 family inner membrane transport protein